MASQTVILLLFRYPLLVLLVLPDDLRARLLAHSDFSDADRAALVQLFDQQRRYGLVWEDKPEAVEETLRQYLPVLEEVPARYLPAAEASAPAHTLIEGDNLHALTVLSYTHAAQVNVIYIDPPYNTGNRDFIYNDRFVDREDGYRHSKWLSFMAKRLKLAKTLLQETGVIFISIDDNEQAALKLLCDEVFGEENFLANIIWQSKKGGGSDNNFLVTEHEYVSVYAKNKPFCSLNKTELEGEELDLMDEIGPYRMGRELNKWGANSRRQDRPTMWFALDGPNGEEVFPIRNDGSEGCWRWGEKKIKKAVKDGDVEFSKRENGTYIAYEKIRHSKPRSKPFRTFINDIGATADGSKVVRDIFGGEKLFAFAKPLKLIDFVLNLSTNSDEDQIILDFFAGSGTTLHATMALNAEDGGSRRCILVTNNENNICEQVTYERNRRVIQGYTTPKGVAVPGLTHNSLRYYRCVAPVPRTPTLRHRRELVRRATDLLCLKESCYQPLPGTLADGAFRAFGSASAATVIVYDDLAVEAAVAFVAALPTPALAPADQPWCAVYVFAPGSYAYQEEFGAVAARVRLSALPEALYRAWQHLLPEEGDIRAVEEAVSSPPAPTSSPSPKKRGEPADEEELETKAEANDLADNVPAAKTDKRGNPVLF